MTLDGARTWKPWAYLMCSTLRNTAFPSIEIGLSAKNVATIVLESPGWTCPRRGENESAGASALRCKKPMFKSVPLHSEAEKPT